MNRFSLFFFFSFVCLYSFAQNYSRVKIITDDAGLTMLSQHGVTIDHGIHKEGQFFISDFSASEVTTMQALNVTIEILIADVVSYYEQILMEPASDQTLRNANCSGGIGASGGFYTNPATPTHFNLGSMGGYLNYNEMLAELDEMFATYPNLITQKS